MPQDPYSGFGFPPPGTASYDAVSRTNYEEYNQGYYNPFLARNTSSATDRLVGQFTWAQLQGGYGTDLGGASRVVFGFNAASRLAPSTMRQDEYEGTMRELAARSSYAAASKFTAVNTLRNITTLGGLAPWTGVANNLLGSLDKRYREQTETALKLTTSFDNTIAGYRNQRLGGGATGSIYLADAFTKQLANIAYGEHLHLKAGSKSVEELGSIAAELANRGELDTTEMGADLNTISGTKGLIARRIKRTFGAERLMDTMKETFGTRDKGEQLSLVREMFGSTRDMDEISPVEARQVADKIQAFSEAAKITKDSLVTLMRQGKAMARDMGINEGAGAEIMLRSARNATQAVARGDVGTAGLAAVGGKEGLATLEASVLMQLSKTPQAEDLAIAHFVSSTAATANVSGKVDKGSPYEKMREKVERGGTAFLSPADFTESLYTRAKGLTDFEKSHMENVRAVRDYHQKRIDELNNTNSDLKKVADTAWDWTLGAIGARTFWGESAYSETTREERTRDAKMLEASLMPNAPGSRGFREASLVGIKYIGHSRAKMQAFREMYGSVLDEQDPTARYAGASAVFAQQISRAEAGAGGDPIIANMRLQRMLESKGVSIDKERLRVLMAAFKNNKLDDKELTTRIEKESAVTAYDKSAESVQYTEEDRVRFIKAGIESGKSAKQLSDEWDTKIQKLQKFKEDIKQIKADKIKKAAEEAGKDPAEMQREARKETSKYAEDLKEARTAAQRAVGAARESKLFEAASKRPDIRVAALEQSTSDASKKVATAKDAMTAALQQKLASDNILNTSSTKTLDKSVKSATESISQVNKTAGTVNIANYEQPASTAQTEGERMRMSRQRGFRAQNLGDFAAENNKELIKLLQDNNSEQKKANGSLRLIADRILSKQEQTTDKSTSGRALT